MVKDSKSNNIIKAIMTIIKSLVIEDMIGVIFYLL